MACKTGRPNLQLFAKTGDRESKDAALPNRNGCGAVGARHVLHLFGKLTVEKHKTIKARPPSDGDDPSCPCLGVLSTSYSLPLQTSNGGPFTELGCERRLSEEAINDELAAETLRENLSYNAPTASSVDLPDITVVMSASRLCVMGEMKL